MSCECSINLIKKLEKDNPNIGIYNLQAACKKCGSYFQSMKKTGKGVGFSKWAKFFIRGEVSESNQKK